MAEDPSALPWSINKDDYELQEVIGELRPGGTGTLGPCGRPCAPRRGWSVCVCGSPFAEGRCACVWLS